MQSENQRLTSGATGQKEEKAHCPMSPQSQRLLGLLDDLKATKAGEVLYRQLERIVFENEQEYADREQVYRFWLRSFLDGYMRHLKPGSAVHVQTKLIHKQLQMPLTSVALKGLRKYMNMFSMHLVRMEMLDEAVLKNTLEPLLACYGAEEKPESIQAPAKEPPERKREAINEQKQALEGMIGDMLPDEDKDTEQRLASTYRQYLSSQYRDTEKVQAMLAKHIQETIDKNRQFGDILQAVRHGLTEAESIKEIDVLRQCLIEDIGTLTETHSNMVDKLAETKDYLKMIEIDSRKLSDELARVRLLSMTDELTDLPNRRAFLRRLEDEMGRTQRYGTNLALAIIDLDGFKSINDEYGHAVGDAVLCCYAEEILTTFRHHDMVARYGGEEFAVLLPNTDEEGALAAMNKVRREAAEKVCMCSGTKVSAPTFSAGLAHYVPGESANSFIQRADDALYMAKRLGRNRIEVNHGPKEGHDDPNHITKLSS